MKTKSFTKQKIDQIFVTPEKAFQILKIPNLSPLSNDLKKNLLTEKSRKIKYPTNQFQIWENL